MSYNLQDDAMRAIESLGRLNDRFEGKKILITGAAGFLGSHFIRYFLSLNDAWLKKPCRVVGYDNFIRGKPKWVSQLVGRVDVEFQDRNIIDPLEIDGVDHIIHAASIASPIFYRQYPLETMNTNVEGIRNILEYARKNPVQSILYLSSSEIYGNPPPQNIPTPETFEGLVSSTGPRACYDESKRYGETLCVTYFRQFDAPVKIVRPFNVYGPGLNPNDGRVIADFFRDAIAKKEICVLSDGSPSRTFCYISDAIDGFIRVLLSGKGGEVYNIGCESPEISVIDLATKIGELEGAKISWGKSDDPDYCVDNPMRRCPDISKVKAELGYDPQVYLDEGLRLAHAWYKSAL